MQMKEEWKDIEGYEGLYQVSNLGQVKRDRVLKGTYSGTQKRPGVQLSRNGAIKFRYTHQLVAEAFLPNPENLPNVLHLDDNVNNNRVDNLRWGTQKDNMQDKKSKGRSYKPLGVKNVNAKLTKELVEEIRSRLDLSVKGNGRMLAKEYKVSTTTITHIRHNKIWK